MDVEARLIRDHSFYQLFEELSEDLEPVIDETQEIAAGPWGQATSNRPPSVWWVGPIAASLCLAALWMLQSGGGPNFDPATTVQILTLEQSQDSSWTEIGWSKRRGSSTLSKENAAFRLGSRLVDLDLAIQADTPQIARQLATEAVVVAEALESEPIDRRLRQIREGVVRGTLEGPTNLFEVLRSELQDPRLHGVLMTGAWIETGRLQRRSDRERDKNNLGLVNDCFNRFEKIDPRAVAWLPQPPDHHTHAP